MNVLDSIVISFGDAPADVEGFKSAITYDEEKNGLNDKGEKKTQFYPGEPIFILCQIETGWYVDKVEVTSGESTHHGLVTRTHKEDRKFFPDTEVVTFAFFPFGGVSGSWYGRTSAISVVEGDKGRAATPPALGDINYPIKANSIEVTPPNGMALGEGETWPIGVVIWVKKL